MHSLFISLNFDIYYYFASFFCFVLFMVFGMLCAEKWQKQVFSQMKLSATPWKTQLEKKISGEMTEYRLLFCWFCIAMVNGTIIECTVDFHFQRYEILVRLNMFSIYGIYCMCCACDVCDVLRALVVDYFSSGNNQDFIYLKCNTRAKSQKNKAFFCRVHFLHPLPLYRLHFVIFFRTTILLTIISSFDAIQIAKGPEITSQALHKTSVAL